MTNRRPYPFLGKDKATKYAKMKYLKLLGKFSTIEITAAIILCIGTLLLAFLLIRKLQNRLTEHGTKESTPTGSSGNKGKHGFAHCQLNEVLGYDFVKIQTQVSIKRETDTAKEEQKNKFEKPNMEHVACMQRMGVTGIQNNMIEDEPEETQEELNKRKEINHRLQIESELKKQAEQNNEAVPPLIYDTIDENWPSNDTIIKELDKRYPNYFDEEGFLSDEEDDDDKQENNLAAPPENPKLYDDIMKINAEQLMELENQLQQGVSKNGNLRITQFEAEHKDFVNT